MKSCTSRLFASAAVVIMLAVSLSACVESRDQAFESAKVDLAAGDTNAALIRLRSVLQADPEFAEARLLLGQTLLESGNAPAAAKELRKAFDAGMDTETVKPLLALALLELGEYKKLLSDFPPQQIASLQVRADILVSQAYAQLLQGDIEASRELLRQAFEASPENPRALTVTASIYGVEGDYEAASAVLEKVLSRQPKSIEALRAKASIALGKGDLPAAIQTMQTLTQLRSSEVGAHYGAVVLLAQAGRVEEARAQAERMQAAVPGHPRTEHVLALMAVQDKDMKAARDHLAQALKDDPEFTPTLLLSGMVNTELEAYELAEKDFASILLRDPDNLPAQRALIRLLLRTQRPDMALALARDMVAKAPERPEVLMAAAIAYQQVGDVKTARSLFETAYAQGATDAKALTGLALARIAGGDTSLGISTLMEASAADDSSLEADLLLVNYYVGQKEFEKALERLASMAGKRSSDARILMMEGEILVAAGRRAQARASFEMAFELQPDNVVSVTHLARLDFSDGKPERARNRFEDAIKRRPDDANILLAYAEWLDSSKADPATIRATIEKAVAVAPGDANAWASLVLFHIRQKDFDQALAVAEKASGAIPRSERLLTLLADLQRRSGKPDLAMATLAQAILIAPDSPQLLVRLADAQLETGDVEAGRESLLRALKLRPGYTLATVRLVALEEKTGSPAAAIAAARELQKLQPVDPIGYSLEAQVLLRQSRWPEAIRVLQVGLEQVKNPQLLVLLHQSLVKSGRADEAARIAADWLKANPREGVVRRHLAHSATAAGDDQLAVRIYSELVADYPDDVAALNNLAMAAYRLGDPKALEYAERARRLAPDNPNVLDTVGLLLVERGDLVGGTELLKRASAAAPYAPELRLNLARALVKSGDTTGARRELEVLVKLGDKYPQQGEVKKLLDGL
ncbi:MAG: PEP-CTERM system TPR-repeat protein PrsT [Candidatus Accumulibacter meliphilus]|uniref:PEP-CTERM system TPR-repeat protein PrsT n=1 Tax=Candidatus Accumulibacter meliphilus TaxID=2211374 RepID=A0A369XSD7_9PROT|nr:MAG: PEP-CTERM system TPR-repeat protein PrsT [Candidatus Accumulibacter meliphilus]